MFAREEPRVKIITASDSSVLVVFGDVIAPEIRRLVLGLFHALQRWRMRASATCIRDTCRCSWTSIRWR